MNSRRTIAATWSRFSVRDEAASIADWTAGSREKSRPAGSLMTPPGRLESSGLKAASLRSLV
ncbi:hypothetical protein [Bradyrhizobium sp. NBAIM32]|uniref:hypothetical protein n=1 Tax=Bradyrhizobium sp. NBAIM32 TaxID=2793809 RepID=UPI001CD7E79C|nr:hypothetical protein [Bradyrhizobium sp. NBAIM32]